MSEENRDKETPKEAEFGALKSLVQMIDLVLIKQGTLKHFTITDPIINKALDYISNYNKIIVTFDIEFHNVVQSGEKNYISVTKNDKQVSLFIRELGAMFLVKDNNNNWNYLGSMFVNFNNSYLGNNIIYVLSKYASTSDTSHKIMEANDSYFDVNDILNNIDPDTNNEDKIKLISKTIKRPFVKSVLGRKDFGILKLFIGYLQNTEGKKFEQTLGNIKRVIKDVPYNITRRLLDANELNMFNKQMKTYYNDKQVVTRTLTKNQEKDFFDMLHQIDKNTCYLVKGKMDFIALKNSYFAVNKKPCPIKFGYVYDIEIFNKLSHDKYGSAQLEKTYIGMSETKIYTEYVMALINKILDYFEDHNFKGHKAHNPLIDSLYTLAVALVVNINLLITLQ